ncbi:hypothetical protein BGZ95_011053 [Linnemannia exigua]|uniref:Uncharacterized protein n=1 Tax=Linnemannia exigua TaxID=604196 RepID=A0AAD4DAH8_9FUNG|nr:hypothetical protein BGZ95_011053 [Linnemannia exigua]
MASDEYDAETDTFYQAFRSPDEIEPIQIPTVRHPTQGDLYVLWCDISTCFPEATRIQYENSFVPMMRDDRLYRVRPHGIQYHPGVVLDVIYGKKFSPKKNRSNGNGSANGPNFEPHADGLTPNHVLGNDRSEKGAVKGEGKHVGGKSGTGNEEQTPATSHNQASTKAGVKNKLAKEEESLKASTTQALQAIHPRRKLPFTIEDVIKHRVKDIVKSRYTWSQGHRHSRFFCFLPRDFTPPPSTTSVEPTALDPLAPIRNDTEFEFFYLCDCGDTSGPKDGECNNRPHWIDRKHSQSFYPVSAEDVDQMHLRTIIPFVGDYMMGVLEMLKYGVYIDMLPQGVTQRVSLMIKYLESKGVQSCESFMAAAMSSDPKSAVTESTLDQLPPIAVLDSETWMELESRIDRFRTEEYADLMPFRTTDGDIRWMCKAHWMGMCSDEELCHEPSVFKGSPMSAESQHDTIYGVWSSRIKNMNRARLYFELAFQIPWNPVFTIWLDWDMTPEEEIEIGGAIGTLSAAVIHILVRNREGRREEAEAGFSCGYLPLTTAALRNPNIETFSLSSEEIGMEYHFGAIEDDMFDMVQLYEPISKARLAMVERGRKGGMIKANLAGSDVDSVIKTTFGLVGGFHQFGELRLGIVASPQRDRLTIKFPTITARDGQAVGYEVEKKKYEGTRTTDDDLYAFFAKREWRDEFSIVTCLHYDREFFYAGYLTEAVFLVSFKDEGPLIRALITSNKRLKSLLLKSKTADLDPSQVYETCKQPLFDHPVIEVFTIHPRKIQDKTQSSFTWRNPNDQAKMRVDIACNQVDRVEAMFQRYGPLIEQIDIDGLSLDVHLIETPVREILQEVVVKGSMEDVLVLGSVLTQAIPVQMTSGKKDETISAVKVEANVGIWTSFLVAIRSKVTELSVRDDPQRRFLRSMELQPVMLPEMPRLRSFHHSSATPVGSSLFDRSWLDMLLQFKGPIPQDIDMASNNPSSAHKKEIFARRSQIPDFQAITDLSLNGVQMTAEDWTKLLGYMDFSEMVKFEVIQKNPMSRETLLQIADAVPRESMALQRFYVQDDGGVDCDAAAALEAKFGPWGSTHKAGGAHVDLNWFVV